MAHKRKPNNTSGAGFSGILDNIATYTGQGPIGMMDSGVNYSKTYTGWTPTGGNSSWYESLDGWSNLTQSQKDIIKNNPYANQTINATTWQKLFKKSKLNEQANELQAKFDDWNAQMLAQFHSDKQNSIQQQQRDAWRAGISLGSDDVSTATTVPADTSSSASMPVSSAAGDFSDLSGVSSAVSAVGGIGGLLLNFSKLSLEKELLAEQVNNARINGAGQVIENQYNNVRNRWADLLFGSEVGMRKARKGETDANTERILNAASYISMQEKALSLDNQQKVISMYSQGFANGSLLDKDGNPISYDFGDEQLNSFGNSFLDAYTNSRGNLLDVLDSNSTYASLIQSSFGQDMYSPYWASITGIMASNFRLSQVVESSRIQYLGSLNEFQNAYIDFMNTHAGPEWYARRDVASSEVVALENEFMLNYGNDVDSDGKVESLPELMAIAKANYESYNARINGFLYNNTEEIGTYIDQVVKGSFGPAASPYTSECKAMLLNIMAQSGSQVPYVSQYYQNLISDGIRAAASTYLGTKYIKSRKPISSGSASTPPAAGGETVYNTPDRTFEDAQIQGMYF